jgi:hypothetical protein
VLTAAISLGAAAVAAYGHRAPAPRPAAAAAPAKAHKATPALRAQEGQAPGGCGCAARARLPGGLDASAEDILSAGITAPAGWTKTTGQTLARDWRDGNTAAWTDANVLTPAGIHACHLAEFDRITASHFGVTPPAQGIQPAPAARAQPPAAAAPHFTNASAVVAQFHQDLNSHDYAGAWALGGRNIGGASYGGWVAGYATAAWIDLGTYGTRGDGTVWANITAGQADGSIRSYYGTCTVSRGRSSRPASPRPAKPGPAQTTGPARRRHTK